jgi:multicomponent K+:H+ antiporter subunit F
LLVVTGIVYGRQLFFEAAILIALLGFVGTVSLASFLLRGDIIE